MELKYPMARLKTHSRPPTTGKPGSTPNARCAAPPPRPSGDLLPGAEVVQAAAGKWAMVDTIRLKSPVIDHESSSRLPRAVERLETREWHALPRHSTVQVEADPGFSTASQGMHGA